VSSRHLEVTWTDGSWFALDLGSTNGTKLNESQVRMMEGARAAAVACVQCAPTQPTASTCARCCCCCCLNTDQRYKLRDGDQLFIGTDTVLQVQIQASVLVLHSAAHPTAP
jgi:pSer/pThr/pTyr-binding forkhead associated (FHA) protein